MFGRMLSVRVLVIVSSVSGHSSGQITLPVSIQSGLSTPSMASHWCLCKSTAPSRYMERTFLSLPINNFFVCLLSGKLVRLEFSLLSRLREHSFLRMKLSTTDYEFLYLSVIYICFYNFFYFSKVNKHYLRLWYM